MVVDCNNFRWGKGIIPNVLQTFVCYDGDAYVCEREK